MQTLSLPSNVELHIFLARVIDAKQLNLFKLNKEMKANEIHT